MRAAGKPLVRIAAAGICGAGVSIWKWHEAVGPYAPRFPVVVGHEFAGYVVEASRDPPPVRPDRPVPRPIAFVTTPAVLKELELIGSLGNNDPTWRLTMRLLPSLTPKRAGLVTHRFRSEDLPEALTTVERRETGGGAP